MSERLHRFSDGDIAKLRTVPIENALCALGKSVAHTGSLYFSPFHDENTPSFHIDRKKNQWFDHGNRDPQQKAGGDVLDLVIGVKGCSFKEACEFLSSVSPGLSVTGETISPQTRPSGESTLSVEKVHSRILSPILRTYATSERHIPGNILDRYCSQVNYRYVYSNGQRSTDHFAIGFPNIEGNWALRNLQKKANKISTGQNFTAVSNDGSFIKADNLKPSSANVVIFEGFFDFMSWLAWNGAETPTKADAVILNSVQNDKKAMDFILAHDKVVCYLDNDEAGKLHTDYIRQQSEAAGRTVVDGSSAYGEHKDLNEAWIKEARRRQFKEFAVLKENHQGAAPHIK